MQKYTYIKLRFPSEIFISLKEEKDKVLISLTSPFVKNNSLLVNNSIKFLIKKVSNDFNELIGISKLGKDNFSNLKESLSLIKNELLSHNKIFYFDLKFLNLNYKLTLLEENFIQIEKGLGQSWKVLMPTNVSYSSAPGGGNKFRFSSFNKKDLTAFVLRLRGFQPINPYTQKGILFTNETFKKKVGKEKVNL